jgi:hypothetical protein
MLIRRAPKAGAHGYLLKSWLPKRWLRRFAKSILVSDMFHRRLLPSLRNISTTNISANAKWTFYVISRRQPESGYRREAVHLRGNP